MRVTRATDPDEAKKLTENTSKGGKLAGRRIAILATDGVEQIELTKPRDAFNQEGAKTVLIAPKAGKIQAYNHHEKGDQLTVDRPLSEAKTADYDALLLPGGVVNPDILRTNAAAVAFVKAFAEADKPIFAICHGPWTLVEADVVKNRMLTSGPSLKTDIANAGGRWVDMPVATDRLLVTSRKPADLPAFIAAAITTMTTPPSDVARAPHSQTSF